MHFDCNGIAIVVFIYLYGLKVFFCFFNLAKQVMLLSLLCSKIADGETRISSKMAFFAKKPKYVKIENI